MTSLKIYLQQSHRFQDFFHSDKSAKEQAMLVNAQRYKPKQVLRQKLNNVDQTFWFSIFYMVFGFLTQKKKKIDQNQQKEINDRMQKQTNKFQPTQ